MDTSADPTSSTPDPTEQIIDVRADEAFDVDAVATVLNNEIPDLTGRPKVRQFGGGKANLTYLLDYGDRELVLRRPPLGPVADKAHDMKREYMVLSKLQDAYPLAPRALAYCGEEDVIGAEFFVMERRTGVVVRESMPEAYADTEDAPQRMSFALIDALADLHAVDFEAVGLGVRGVLACARVRRSACVVWALSKGCRMPKALITRLVWHSALVPLWAPSPGHVPMCKKS